MEFGCLATGLPLLLRWCLCLPRWRCGCIERGVRYSRCCTKFSSVEVPSVGVLGGRDSGLEILLGEGEDVELGARTSEHILSLRLIH